MYIKNKALLKYRNPSEQIVDQYSLFVSSICECWKLMCDHCGAAVLLCLCSLKLKENPNIKPHVKKTPLWFSIIPHWRKLVPTDLYWTRSIQKPRHFWQHFPRLAHFITTPLMWVKGDNLRTLLTKCNMCIPFHQTRVGKWALLLLDCSSVTNEPCFTHPAFDLIADDGAGRLSQT